MILVGLGANLPTPGYAGPRETLEAALDRLRTADVDILAVSPWYRTAPVPASARRPRSSAARTPRS